MKLAIIGGTGLDSLHTSDALFLHRHRGGIPPHLIPHDINAKFLKKSGVTHAIGVTACGSLTQRNKPGEIRVPLSFIDATGFTRHVIEDIQHPIPEYDPIMQRILFQHANAANAENWTSKRGATAECMLSIRGPRFATAHEARLYYNAGADLINMTTGPEGAMMIEAGIKYAVLAFVTDFDGSVPGERPSTYEDIKARMDEGMNVVQSVLNAAITDTLRQ